MMLTPESPGGLTYASKKVGPGLPVPTAESILLRLWLYPPHSSCEAATTPTLAQGVVEGHSHL